MIKLRSFRLRTALLSASLAGTALVGFGLLSWLLIYNAKVDRLDAELKNQLIRAGRPPRENGWQFFESSLSVISNTDTKTAALQAIDINGNILHRSYSWPADLNINPLLSRIVSPLPPPITERDARPRRRFRAYGPPPQPQFVTQHAVSGDWRVGAVAFPNFKVAIAVNLKAIDREMEIIRNVFIISIPVLLLVVAGGAWAISGSALHPISQLTNSIRDVTANGLDQRVPIGKTDTEFIELIQVFNQMLERLERSFKQASRFSADAAHELKTPLTILRGELEQMLQQAEYGSAEQQSLSNLLDEVYRLSEIVRKLLLLSLADAGQMGLHKVEVNLSELLAEMVEDMDLLAPHLDVKTDIAIGLNVLGDRDLLKQVLQNLISNAIKYNLPSGWILINGRQQETTVLVTISNASKDIPDSERSLIFDRFYRGDPARTRKVEGLGLGLSLAQEITRAHNGTLTLDRTISGQTAFTLSLPFAKKSRGHTVVSSTN